MIKRFFGEKRAGFADVYLTLIYKTYKNFKEP